MKNLKENILKGIKKFNIDYNKEVNLEQRMNL